MPPDFLPPWLIPAAFAIFGACIGSFLNVVIYRTPLGLPLGEPSRSFCPGCKTPIPWYFNIPVASWLILRGKCASCKSRISIRYWLVEIITAALFLAIAAAYDGTPLWTRAAICIWIAAAIAIAFIDAETMLVFPRHTCAGALAGLLAACSFPLLVNGEPDTWTDGLANSLTGAAAGFIIIRLIIILGRILFGSWKQSYDKNSAWSLKEPERDDQELTLVLPDRDCSWSELFARPADKAILRDATLLIDGNIISTDTVTISENKLEASDGSSYKISDISSAHGTLSSIKANREAMGSGDAWIMMMVGALCGWEGSLFTILCASFIGILAAVILRFGFNRPMPFGPSLLAAAVIWLFCGKQLWIWYLNWIS